MSQYQDDDDVIIESTSGPGTPMDITRSSASLASDMVEYRNTPPLHRGGGSTTPMPHSSSSPSLNRMSTGGGASLSQASNASQSKYAQLLMVIEEMGKDIRPTYAGSKTSTERLKRNIMHARILVRECLMECDRAARM